MSLNFPSRPLSGAVVALAACALLAGCTDNTSSATTTTINERQVKVTSSDTACAVSSSTAPSGNLTFSVTNDGNKVTEFYLLADDGLRIIAEVENIGPGLSRDLVLTAAPGQYLATCKPGMVGDGIRSTFMVTDSGADTAPAGDQAEMVAEANRQYGSYVKDQTEQLLTKTRQFASLYKAGKDDRARALYPRARQHWERIETVAESFGDLDPKMDLRETDLTEGQSWTGWHRMEKDLWPAEAKNYHRLDHAARAKYADDLVANTADLYRRTRSMTFTVDQIANGSLGLLDEVATGKVTGEEERWSHTDLWDFQANVDGARVGFAGLRPLLKKKDPGLDAKVDTQFRALQKLLDQHRVGDRFQSYQKLKPAELKALSDAVNALSEPLSRLTAAVI